MIKQIAAPFLLGLSGLVFISCGILPTGTGDEESGTVYLWIGADKDTYVSARESNRNFGGNGFLVVAGNQDLSIIKRSYVHFLIPNLPEGTEIEEAYLELYHPGKNEDGKRDDISIPVVRAVKNWSPLTMTYDDQPNSFPSSHEFSLNLRSQAWSGSDDIVSLVRQIFDNPDTFHGFVLFWPDVQLLGIEKGFYSNNSQDRTAGDMGRSPRLLVKVTLPDGKSTDDITLPPFPSDNDLEFDGQDVQMLRYAGGDDWPEDWNVAVTKG